MCLITSKKTNKSLYVKSAIEWRDHIAGKNLVFSLNRSSFFFNRRDCLLELEKKIIMKFRSQNLYFFYEEEIAY